MKDIIICVTINGRTLCFSGYEDKLTGKGLGSGALTGTNRVPKFSDKPKRIETYIDAKRIMSEIIDAVRYKEIEGVERVSVYFGGVGSG